MTLRRSRSQQSKRLSIQGATSGHRTTSGDPPEVPTPYGLCGGDRRLLLVPRRTTTPCRAATIETDALSPIDCAQLGFEARSGARVSSNVNGTTACTSHVCGKTGARQIIEGSTECGAYSWAICGWTSNSGLGLTVASSAIAAEAKMNIDPAARANCKDFRITFLRRFLVTHTVGSTTARVHSPSRRHGGGAAVCCACSSRRKNDPRISALWRLSYLSAADFGASNSV